MHSAGVLTACKQMLIECAPILHELSGTPIVLYVNVLRRAACAVTTKWYSTTEDRLAHFSMASL